MRIAAGLAVALAAAACSQAKPLRPPEVTVLEPCQVELVRSIPPVVRARVDGRPDLEFLVDTGSDTTWIDRTMAEALGFEIRPGPGAREFTGSDGRSVASESCVSVQRIEIGSMLVEGLTTPAIDSESTRVHGWFGILGQDVLNEVILVVDAERGRLHLLPPSTDEDGVSSYVGKEELGFGKWAVADVSFRPCPFLVFDVEGLEGGEMRLELDTGSTATSLPAAAIEALELRETGTYSAHAIAGVHEGRTFRLEDLDLYGLKISGDVQEGKLPHGLFGMDILGLLVFVVDAPHQRVWFHRRAAEEAR